METNAKSKEKIGILLIGHGSSLAEGNSVTYALSEMYTKMSEYPVQVGFMNIENQQYLLHLMLWLRRVWRK